MTYGVIPAGSLAFEVGESMFETHTRHPVGVVPLFGAVNEAGLGVGKLATMCGKNTFDIGYTPPPVARSPARQLAVPVAKLLRVTLNVVPVRIVTLAAPGGP